MKIAFILLIFNILVCTVYAENVNLSPLYKDVEQKENSLKPNLSDYTDVKMLNQLKDSTSLMDNTQAEVKELEVNPGKQDMRDHAAAKLKEEMGSNSTADIVAKTAVPTDDEKKAFQNELSSKVPPLNDVSNTNYTSKSDFTPNLTETAVGLWIASELVSDAKKDLTGDEGYDAEGKMLATQIFQGKQLDCSYQTSKWVGWAKIPSTDSCSVKVKDTHYYKCADTGKTFKTYESCADSCSNVCKKHTDTSPASVSMMGVTFQASISGITESQKELALAKHYNQCFQSGSRTSCIDKDLLGNCLQRKSWQYYCCFTSPMAMDLARTIKSQLGLNVNTCSGIPLAQFEKVDFSDPRLVSLMERQTKNVVNQSMTNHYQTIVKDTKPNVSSDQCIEYEQIEVCVEEAEECTKYKNEIKMSDNGPYVEKVCVEYKKVCTAYEIKNTDVCLKFAPSAIGF